MPSIARIGMTKKVASPQAVGELGDQCADQRRDQRPECDPPAFCPSHTDCLAGTHSLTVEGRARGTGERDIEKDAGQSRDVEGGEAEQAQLPARRAGRGVGREEDEQQGEGDRAADAGQGQSQHCPVAADQLPGDLRQAPATADLPLPEVSLSSALPRLHLSKIGSCTASL